MCKGIDTAVTEILPNAAHGLCAFHIGQNVDRRYGKGAAARVWSIANAGTGTDYEAAMHALEQVSPAARAYLEQIPREQWVRAFFPMPRYGHVTSNIAESVNALLVEQRKMPPFWFFVETLRKVNGMFARRREKYRAMPPDDIVENVLAELAQNGEVGRRLEARNVHGLVFDVQSRVAGRAARVVDLSRRECSCKMFQDLGYPCVHACSAAIMAGVDVPSLCIEARRVRALQAVYARGVVPADIEDVPSEPVLPPIPRRLPGRPHVSRFRPAHETRQKRENFCSKCHRSGHNRTTCPENVA